MIDLKETNDGDLAFENRDLTYTEATGQHKRDILLAGKGCYKETPEIGVAAQEFLHDDDPENFCRTVRKECARDGMKVKDIKLTGGDLIIDAEYGKGKR